MTRDELDDAAIEMFWLFSRMEYALKAAGYLVEHTTDAKANWSKFAADIDQRFREMVAEDAALADAVAYFQGDPPKKQVVIDGQITWSGVLPEANSETGVTLLLVSRVRNNLFHGGKFGARWVDPPRSKALVPRALTILRSSLKSSPAVEAAFRG